ncbi:sulfotransferase (plasmid) [Salipiger sp. H15]|uniref:Sulfotransferase n=1 Tax=Alloyangia sp. H15 TaxID=3029062 RepID=A0AAU8APR7_9RHOB
MQHETLMAKTLPDFIIIGAMRAGTTSLHNYFQRHPQVSMSHDKEPNYFTEKKYELGEDWYVGQFDVGQMFRGEASPNYAKVDVFPGVPERIHRDLPDVKLVYVVRDPVKRFVSQYDHMVSRGFGLPEPGELCRHEDPLPPEPVRLTLDEPYRHILSISCYARQLKAYLHHFPLEQIKIVEFERLKQEPEVVLEDLQAFLGLDPLGPRTLPLLNRSKELTSVPQPILRSARDTRIGNWVRDRMSLETRDRLKRLIAAPFPDTKRAFPDEAIHRVRRDLADDIAEFRELTGMPFSSWSV